MARDENVVVVQKRLFDRLRQHCECCPYFDKLLENSSDERTIVIPSEGPSSEPSKKRKTLHGSGPQEVSQPSHSLQQSEQQLPSQSSGAKRQQKEAAAKWFLKNAPKAIEWRKRQAELDLNTVEQYEQIIRAFTDRTNITTERKLCHGDGHSDDQLIDLANRFALLTKSSFSNANLQRSFASFQVLILLSYCEVLRKRGVSYEAIDPIIQHVAGRELSRRRLLDSAPWINGLIFELVSHGWTIYRATELFFISMSSKYPIFEFGLTCFL